MEVMLIASLIQGVAPLIAKGISEAVNAGDRAKAERLAAQAVDQFKFDVPELAKLAPTPVQSSLDTGTDDAVRALQLRALDQLGAEASGGMTAEDAQAMAMARNAAGQVDAGLRGAAQDRAAARGLGGSMTSYLGDLQGAQAGANAVGAMDAQMAADRRARQLQALGMLGQAAGDVRGQGMARASAQDALNRFNSGMAFDAARGNNANAMQRFDAQMKLGNARADAMRAESDRLSGKAARTGRDWAAAGEAVAGGAQAVGDAYGYGKSRGWKWGEDDE